VYFTSEEGDIHIIRAGDTFDPIGTNHHGERLMATPAIADGTLYFRGATRLVAVREGAGPGETQVSSQEKEHAGLK
ncbi:MAG: hypothetical protein K8J08_17075, partial [Thermoanaerobaculia bacterium]|nr:hypothetical protein [Thermoanaerobaculia bacterium]